MKYPGKSQLAKISNGLVERGKNLPMTELLDLARMVAEGYHQRERERIILAAKQGDYAYVLSKMEAVIRFMENSHLDSDSRRKLTDAFCELALT